MAESWTCPTCGEKYRADVVMCRNCRVTSVIRREGLTGFQRPLRRTKSSGTMKAVPEKPEPPDPPPPPPPAEPAPPPPGAGVEVHFPVLLKDVKYRLPVITGEISTVGILLATRVGIYLLSDEDGLDAHVIGRSPAPPEGHLARLSVFLPRSALQRLVRSVEHLEAKGGRVGLQLSGDGWEELDLICDALGIPRS